jgi:hypothetical protein
MCLGLKDLAPAVMHIFNRLFLLLLPLLAVLFLFFCMFCPTTCQSSGLQLASLPSKPTLLWPLCQNTGLHLAISLSCVPIQSWPLCQGPGLQLAIILFLHDVLSAESSMLSVSKSPALLWSGSCCHIWSL